ncbi:MAG: hypothetical protein A2W05_11060 [Candidatus Schekmanbacteria bacterium RBG_16_38_10]|uniref:Cation tolerance protein CutA n=1 Tax=Candidatus Schekmanbacteria bacterium RBG_16_38_10 TaxID=1817879 RepID=A0A1F7RXC9_9BACT|nr:MAG: hypothetical protein A2W05_11060 [Candidatus Schekmanbacteria bacterium RBG_16_38_10]
MIITTVNSDSAAKKIAQALIEEKLAACVNIIPSVTSIFRWEGKVSTESELILIAKSKEKLFDEIKDKILSLHPYKLPEIITVPIVDGSKEYLKWVEDELKDISA